jgi:hypothetical protein
MRWLIIYLLAMAVIWLFIKGTSLRRGLMAAVTTLFVMLMIILTLSENNSDNAGLLPTNEQFSQVQQRDALRQQALSASDVAIRSASLANIEVTQFDSAGRERTRPDPLRWTFKAELLNRSQQYKVSGVVLRVRLYSCPEFLSTPQDDMNPSTLSASCSQVGQRTVGLETIGLAPGAAQTIEQEITFPNQTEATNSRFWVDVQTVTAGPREDS